MNEFAKPTVEDVDTAMRAFEALLADLTTRRDGLLARPRLTSRFEHGQLADCQRAITQLQKGVQPEDGVVPDVDALVHSEQVRRLTLKAPGLASLQRLRDSCRPCPRLRPPQVPIGCGKARGTACRTATCGPAR